MSSELLIVFVKNPELGKVKTRLAATIGPEQALEVYRMLLQKTKESIQNLPMVKTVYYSSYIDHSDLWDNDLFKKALQHGDNLGEKMFHAIKSGFEAGYQSVGIIGSDCPDVSEELLKEAFMKLKMNDVVIGPAKDGGYYFLGMNQLYKPLFLDKSWSTEKLLQETLQNISQLNLNLYLLDVLNDIDEEQDLTILKDSLKTGDR